MSHRTFELLAVLTLLLTQAASGQSRPGISFDQTVRTVREHDSSTVVQHITTVGSDVRMEVDAGSSAKGIGPFPFGDERVMILRDGGAQLIMLNPEKKQYFSMKPVEMMESSRKMLDAMGGSMHVDSSASATSIDSLGPGSVVDGHPTLRYTVKSVIKFTMSMMGQQVSVNQEVVQDIETATDVGDLGEGLIAGKSIADMGAAMGLGKDFFRKGAAPRYKIAGLPVHVVKRSTNLEKGQARTTTETSDVRNFKRVSVPDSVFAIPADYKFISLPFASSGGIK
jgi:hypothetical protein